MKTIKELEAEVNEMVDDEDTINNYELTLKDIDEKFESEGYDLKTQMFILLKVAKLRQSKNFLKLIDEEIKRWDENEALKELKQKIQGK